MRVTSADFAAVKSRRPRPRRERDVQAATSWPIFIPGRLVNPLNARQGWKAVWARSRRARMVTRDRALIAQIIAMPRNVWVDREMSAKRPKRITFTAHVGGKWDDDNLPAAIKAYRDGLVDAKVIHSDAPDSGHEFVYRQRINRGNLGVEISVDAVLAALR